MAERLSIQDAARRLGVSSSTIRRAIRRGELVAHEEVTPSGPMLLVELDEALASGAAPELDDLAARLRSALDEMGQPGSHLAGEPPALPDGEAEAVAEPPAGRRARALARVRRAVAGRPGVRRLTRFAPPVLVAAALLLGLAGLRPGALAPLAGPGPDGNGPGGFTPPWSALLGGGSDGQSDRGLPFAPAVPAPDWEVPGGRFFTQMAGGRGQPDARGFAVTDAAGIRFWSAFTDLGGVAVLGYPISERFVWKGLVTQVFEQAALQWHPATERAELVLLLDELSDAGRDEWLEERYRVPRRLDWRIDVGKPWQQVVEDRLRLLAGHPDLLAFYLSAANPLDRFGLPASSVVDRGDHWVVRTQRTVLRWWKAPSAVAAAGEVTADAVGRIAYEAGLFPTEPFAPMPAPNDPAQLGVPSRPVEVEATPTTAPAAQLVVANTDGLGVYLRRTPEIGDRIRAWPEGTPLVPLGPRVRAGGRDWTPVRAPDGVEGWVPSEYLVTR